MAARLSGRRPRGQPARGWPADRPGTSSRRVHAHRAREPRADRIRRHLARRSWAHRRLCRTPQAADSRVSESAAMNMRQTGRRRAAAITAGLASLATIGAGGVAVLARHDTDATRTQTASSTTTISTPTASATPSASTTPYPPSDDRRADSCSPRPALRPSPPRQPRHVRSPPRAAARPLRRLVDRFPATGQRPHRSLTAPRLTIDTWPSDSLASARPARIDVWLNPVGRPERGAAGGRTQPGGTSGRGSQDRHPDRRCGRAARPRPGRAGRISRLLPQLPAVGDDAHVTQRTPARRGQPAAPGC